jgi:ELWxxDGT repeat protein
MILGQTITPFPLPSVPSFPPGNAAELTNSPFKSQSRSLLFIDSAVPDAQTLVENLAVDTEVHVLRSDEDAITQITQSLFGQSGIATLQIISHGKPGGIQLGASWLDWQTLPRYVNQLKTWGQALTADADILLYGCNVGKGRMGSALIDLLAQTTGADVAASDDLTGSQELAGDWDLEVRTGLIESPILAANTYTHILPLLKDINPGIADSNPGGLTNINGTLYFFANDGGIDGLRVWQSDGTEIGTILATDYFRKGSFPPRNLTDVNGTLYFVEYTNPSYNLWKSDGTEAGSVLVKDFSPYSGIDIASESRSAAVNNTLYFVAFDPLNGNELWKSDGTETGTVLVRDIAPGISNSYPRTLTNVNGALYFTASDSTTGDADNRELWKSDGTEAGTVLVKEINPGSASAAPYQLTNVNGTLYFTATDGASGYELWKSDGTAAGTVLVKDISPGIQDSLLSNFTNVNGTLYFFVYTNNNYALWKSDGTEAGTVLVKNNISTTSPIAPISFNDTFYFVGADEVNGYELWKSDGTEAGTVLAKDINPGSESSGPSSLTSLNGLLYFAAENGRNGYELWVESPNSLIFDVVLQGNLTTIAGVSTQSVNNWATDLTQPSYPQGLSYVVTVDRPELFEQLPTLTRTGQITYTPKPYLNINAVINLKVEVRQANGLIDNALTKTATLTFKYQPEALVRDSITGELGLLYIDRVTQLQAQRTLIYGDNFGAKAGQAFTLTQDVSIADTADFNRDGVADILLHTASGDEVSLLIMGKEGRVIAVNPLVGQAGNVLKTGNLNWKVVGFADIDRDNILDIVWHNQQSDEIGFWLMNANAQSVKRYDYVRDSNGNILKTNNTLWQVMDLADFDGDGDTDLLFRLKELNQTAIVQLQGQTFINAQYLTANSDPSLIFRGMGDADGDLIADIYWQTPNNGQVLIQSIKFRAGKWLSESFKLVNQGGNVPLQGIADLDRNNTADLLWRDLTSDSLLVKVVESNAPAVNLQRQGQVFQFNAPNQQIVQMAEFGDIAELLT